MWNNPGGGGYDQGGGYLNSPNVGTSQQQSRQAGRQRAQNIMPCTVGQITKAEMIDDKFLTGNIELNQIVLVGLVRSSTETSTRLDYEIDDMTAPPLAVRQFVDNDENTPDAERTLMIRENIYVRVHGHVRAFAGKRSVVAFRVAPIADMNELTTHMLEVIYAHAYLVQAGTSMDTSAPAPQQSVASASNAGPQPVMNGAHPANIGGHLDIGLTPDQQQVLNVLRSTMDEQGLSITTVSSQLKHMSQRVIRDAIEFLSSEGHIYSTIDDEHYKPTDS